MLHLGLGGGLGGVLRLGAYKLRLGGLRVRGRLRLGLDGLVVGQGGRSVGGLLIYFADVVVALI
jgi:hypothetical protein